MYDNTSIYNNLYDMLTHYHQQGIIRITHKMVYVCESAGYCWCHNTRGAQPKFYLNHSPISTPPHPKRKKERSKKQAKNITKHCKTF